MQNEELTQEQIELKAAELKSKYGVNVLPLVFKIGETGPQIVGYVKEPPRHVKLRMMDSALTASTTVSSSVLDEYLIKEESDPRIYNEGPDNDPYYIGACMEVSNVVKVAVNQFKKK
jgi:hypothetical protein